MSNDKRMGVNPLEWMNPATEPKTETMPSVAGATPCAPSASGGIILPPEPMNQENSVSKGKIKIKQTMDTSQALAHLQDLAQSLDTGIIRAEDGETKLVLGVADTMQFEMKISKKKDKAKCSIEMEWQEDQTKLDSFKIKSEA